MLPIYLLLIEIMNDCKNIIHRRRLCYFLLDFKFLNYKEYYHSITNNYHII